MSLTSDPRIDRLYQLLPAIYRIRDSEQGYPLKALLRVIAEQVNLVEDDISRLYDNSFIETAEDWAVPYIADLIGYRPVTDPGEAGNATTQEGRQLYRALIPRREVANTIRYRRRKGTLALLELLANDIADWPARAVEFYKLLAWNQNINHQHLKRARTVDLRQMNAIDLLDGPFDAIAHTVDVRRINSTLTLGRFNIPSVGVSVWRLKPYSVTQTPAHRPEHAPSHCGTFSVLGQDTQLFIKPEREDDPTHIAGELNLPSPVRALSFRQSLSGRADEELYYGEKKSLAIWAEGWAKLAPPYLVPVDKIIHADLSDWRYTPQLGKVAVDPVLGRFAFHPDQLPQKAVRVSYHYVFSSDIGGGEYQRQLADPSPRLMEEADPLDTSKTITRRVAPVIYKVGKGQSIHRIEEALRLWEQEHPWDTVIELTDSGVYSIKPRYINLDNGRTLQIRASNGSRPVIRLHRQADWQSDSEDTNTMVETFTVIIEPGGRFTLDGLLISGWALHINSPQSEQQDKKNDPVCLSQVLIRHCTLVPGWELECDCEPKNAEEPSLEFHHLRAKVHIEHSILGAIQIHEDEVYVDPIPIMIADSLLDATAADKEAIGAPGEFVAHASLTILRSTVFGIVNTHAIVLAENSIFNDCVNVARRQLGCMRFCYVPQGCRTPKRYHCQPDAAVEVLRDVLSPEEVDPLLIDNEQLRLIPRYTARRYGLPGYGQLSTYCAEEIRQGADDESEMGAFHDLFQPQRTANLLTRLNEYTPAGMDVGLIFVT